MLTVDSFQSQWPPAQWARLHVVVAVSGGLDSVALLRLMVAARSEAAAAGGSAPPPTGPSGQLIVAHFDHQLREGSADDAAWVAELAGRLGLSFEPGRAEGVDVRSEQQARQARYAFLTRVAEATGARYVVTGHSSDDQAETILHHAIRGTGLAGLAGMPRRRLLTPAVTLLRPLLACSRGDLREYLDSIGQTYREDPSNELVDFTRNRLRNELIPLLERDYNPHVKASLLRLGQLAGQAQQEIEAAVHLLMNTCITTSAAEATMQLDQLGAASPYLIRELLVALWKHQRWPLQNMTFDKWYALAQLAEPNASATVHQMPGGIRVTRRESQLIMQRIGAREPPSPNESDG